MLVRTLGKTNLQVTAIGLGTWNIGGQWGAVDDATAIATIRAAYEAGVNLFDTADAYGEPPGRSEELLGRAVTEMRPKVIIATKVGNFARRAGHPLAYTHPAHVELCCDASLNRMRTDVIDLYQCHIGELDDYSVFLEAFATLKKKGKIRFSGLSTNSLRALECFNREGQCDLLQLDYSLLNRTPEKELLPYCQQHRIGTLVRGPLAQGVAAGKFSKDSVFSDSVREKWNSGAAHDRLLKQIETIERLKFLAADRTMAQAALQFVISHPAVTCAIPGAKSPEQARANAQAGRATLTPDELRRIDSV